MKSTDMMTLTRPPFLTSGVCANAACSPIPTNQQTNEQYVQPWTASSDDAGGGRVGRSSARSLRLAVKAPKHHDEVSRH